VQVDNVVWLGVGVALGVGVGAGGAIATLDAEDEPDPPPPHADSEAIAKAALANHSLRWMLFFKTGSLYLLFVLSILDPSLPRKMAVGSPIHRAIKRRPYR
jgi:hypothetical protein